MKKYLAFALAIIIFMAVMPAVFSSSVDVAVVDVTAPTGSVTISRDGSAPIVLGCTISGKQEGTATFQVYKDWTLSSDVFSGSNPQTFTVGPREATDPASTQSTTGTVTVATGQSGGTFFLHAGAFNITNSNSTGAKLNAGSSSDYAVTVPDVIPITVTADPQTKVYGEADPDPLTYTCDTEGVEFTGALERADGENENVGTYAIEQGNLDAGSNYSITFVGDDLTITPKGITVTADPQTKVYGEADPPLTYTCDPEPPEGTLSGALVRDPGENVGKYAINQGDLDAGSNYAIAFVGADFTINKPVVLTVTSIEPIVLGNGKGNKNAAVTISGFNFIPGSKTKVKIVQSGVAKPKKKAAKKVVVVNDHTITCNLNLTSALPGTYDVVVTSKYRKTGTLKGGLRVTPHPVITKPTTPFSGKIGTSTVTLTLNGSNYQAGATVKLTKGSFPDIPVSNVVVSADGTTLTCDLDLTSAVLGSYKGVVTNPDNGIGTFHFIGTK